MAEQQSSLLQRVPDKAWLPAAVILSLVVTMLFRLALPATAQVNESSDFISFYEPVAVNLVDGKGIMLDDGSPAVRYPPGFSLILASTYEIADLLGIPRPVGLDLMIVLCSAGTAALIYGLAARLWPPPSAFAASAVWITYPAALWLTKQPNSEIPYLLFLLAACLAFLRGMESQSPARLLVLSGVLAGAATLIRPMGIGSGLILAILTAVLLDKLNWLNRVWLAGLIVASNLLVILPWQLWLNTHTEQFALLSSGSVPSMRDGLTFAVADKDRAELNLPPDVISLQQYILDQYSALKTPEDIASTIVEAMRRHPAATTKLLLVKAGRAWYGTDSHRMDKYVLIMQIPYLALFFYATGRGWFRHQQSRQFLILMLVMTLYSWLMTIVALSILRYMLPAISLLCVTVPAAWQKHQVWQINE